MKSVLAGALFLAAASSAGAAENVPAPPKPVTDADRCVLETFTGVANKLQSMPGLGDHAFLTGFGALYSEASLVKVINDCVALTDSVTENYSLEKLSGTVLTIGKVEFTFQ